MAAGLRYGIAPYGVEALDVMRIEKGFVSSEINHFTTADDIGLGWMLSTKKDYVGCRMKERDGLQDKQRE